MTYVVSGDSVTLGDGVSAALSADTAGTVTVPADVTNFDLLNLGLREGGEYYEILMAGCENFKTNTQPALLKALHARTLGDIYWTALYNPFAGATIEASELFPGLAKRLDADLVARLSLDLNGLGAMYHPASRRGR